MESEKSSFIRPIGFSWYVTRMTCVCRRLPMQWSAGAGLDLGMLWALTLIVRVERRNLKITPADVSAIKMLFVRLNK